MKDLSRTFEIATCLQEMVRDYNRQRAIDALGKSVLGIVFSLLTFGFLYCCAWFFGSFFARSLGLHAWQFAALLSGLFFAVAIWSAWRHVEPFADLPPRMPDRQELMHALVGQAVGIGYFNPRHAVAGFAVLLIGGPANVLEGLGIWATRLRADQGRIEDAACLLAACAEDYSIEEVREPASGLLLKRLALVKVIRKGDSPGLALTEKGAGILAKTGTHARKKSAGSEAFDRRER